ncbi:Glycosyl hydrolases 36 [Dillenia turbinata]|uniref:Glycosyl hydrolases 36 n=1 Tax=Dillenia turbinata TaxID=194707 RepID=A0AAN8ZPG2_9MAGN
MQEITNNISFAPIGLLDMFNSSGAVEQFDTHLVSDKNPELFDGEAASNVSTLLSENRSPTATITLKVRGCSRFGAYSSQRPLKCRLDNVETDFNYDITSGLLTLSIPVPEVEMYRWSIHIVVRQRENEDVISAGACKEEAVRACIVLHHPKYGHSGLLASNARLKIFCPARSLTSDLSLYETYLEFDGDMGSNIVKLRSLLLGELPQLESLPRWLLPHQGQIRAKN